MDRRYGDERTWRLHRLVALALQQADGDRYSMDYYEKLASAAIEVMLELRVDEEAKR